MFPGRASLPPPLASPRQLASPRGAREGQRALAPLTLALVLSWASSHCGPRSDGPASSSSASPTTTAAVSASLTLASTWKADADSSRRAQLLRAELARRPELVTEADLASRDRSIRVAAVRALARSQHSAARAGLLRMLADEDPEVVAWAAYGLGSSCGEPEPVVAALAATAARWLGPAEAAATSPSPSAPAAPGSAGPSAPPPASVSASARALVSPPAASSALAPLVALGRAIGRCGGAQAEAMLLPWLKLSRRPASAAVLGLGELGERSQKLREETAVALLELAAGDVHAEPFPEALFPLTRVPHLPPSVVDRAREVAARLLEERSPARLFAVLTLARTEERAAPLLADVVRHADRFTLAERAHAARALGALGRDGQRALGELLPALAPAGPGAEVATLMGEQVVVLLTVLETLGTIGAARPLLQRLANLSASAELPRAALLRVSHVRCAAAKLLSERDFASPLLTSCDLLTSPTDGLPAPGIGARAIVAAIGIPGAEIKGARLQAWRRYLEGPDLRAREAALSLLVDHAEVETAAQDLTRALQASEPGLVATAAEVLAKVPARASDSPRRKPGRKERQAKEGEGGPPRAELVEALLGRLDGKGPTADVEALATVVDAVGALGLDQARPTLETLCRGPHATVRERAFKALERLPGGAGRASCDAPAEGMVLPPELSALASSPVSLRLTTDVGELRVTLDPSLAPAAVSRIVELARAGFYRGMSVHRVVPGFVAQLGSPTADGYGGAAERPPLPCETSPIPFGQLGVGMALSGRDTGSSQWFVTQASFPHLDGRYAWLGTASGPWDSLVEGDRVRDVVVSP